MRCAASSGGGGAGLGATPQASSRALAFRGGVTAYGCAQTPRTRSAEARTPATATRRTPWTSLPSRGYGGRVRRVFRLMNVAVALVTLASALAVFYSDLTVPGYREHYRDALWFVVAYSAVQIVMLVEFARDGRHVPWLALLKAVAAWVFLAAFASLWPYWGVWTPARYVYQLFDWGESTRIGLYALVFLGRGVWNTLNAFYFTQPWWRRLRITHPLLGRMVTVLPLAGMILCIWMFMQLVREEAETFSPEARAVARLVYEGLDCDAVRTNDGKTTDDVRQRGERRYHVRIAWGCAETRVLVQAEDGRMGAAAGPQLACCERPETLSRGGTDGEKTAR